MDKKYSRLIVNLAFIALLAGFFGGILIALFIVKL